MFIHYPRTGGSSIQHYILNALPGEYYPIDDEHLRHGQKAWITHQGLGVAYKYARRLGLDPTAIPALVCIRNPYSLMVSGFAYLSQRWAHRIPDLEDNFLDYLLNLEAKTPPEKKRQWAEAPYGQYTDYLMVDGEIPANLEIGRTESLRDDVMAFLRDRLKVRPCLDFPRRNVSRHGNIASYYTAAEEALVYRMWKNAFDNGLYQRYEGLDRNRL